MADERVSRSKSVIEKKAARKESPVVESPDKDLQSIFKKLRVDSKPKRLQQRARAHSLCRTMERNMKSKEGSCMLKQPTFVYKGGHLRRDKKSKKPDSQRVETPDLKTNKKLGITNVSSRELARSKQIKWGVKPTPELKDITSGCSEQHRRAQSVGRCTELNFDDTTPEELAAYFEQLLHIPKPMSAMAEMMYT